MKFGLKVKCRTMLALVTLSVACLARGQNNAAYAEMAPVEQYRMEKDAEITLARSAGPDSISRDAEILVLGAKGFKTAIKGTNGFVCLVQRSWAAGLDDPEFWNPKLRAPICLNAAAVRSYLPHITRKAEWALAGLSKTQIREKVKGALDSKELPPLESGAMCYMLSKQGYLSDRDGNWRPHLMFFVPLTDPAAWGANLPASPVIGFRSEVERVSIFLVPVGKWSDGTPAPPM